MKNHNNNLRRYTLLLLIVFIVVIIITIFSNKIERYNNDTITPFSNKIESYNNDTTNDTNTPLYNITLCCIIKDEKYLEEFIIYYRVLGVDHICIYDNESVPPIRERLNKDYFKDFCTIIDLPGKIKQPTAYMDCLQNFGKFTKWLIFVDGDEYILPKKHTNLIDFLQEYDDAQAIGINWLMFGSSYHDKKPQGFLIDNYRHCNTTQNPHIKSIVKPEYIINEYKDPHYF
jgi:hypothetical protein